MNTKPQALDLRAITRIVIAAVSAVIAIGIFTAVTALLQRDGVPFEQLVNAERACTGYTFKSEREDCVRAYVAASRGRVVASR